MKTTMTVTERRGLDRSAGSMIISFREQEKDGGYCLGITNNVSAGGACFESSRVEYVPGQRLDCVLKHPGSGLSLSSTATVVWKREGWFKCTAGVRFRDLDDDGGAKMSALISTLSGAPILSGAGASSEGGNYGCSFIPAALDTGTEGVETIRNPLLKNIRVQGAETAGHGGKAAPRLPAAGLSEQQKLRVPGVLSYLVAGVAIVACLSWALFSEWRTASQNGPYAAGPRAESMNLLNQAGTEPLPEQGPRILREQTAVLSQQTEADRDPLTAEIDRAVLLLQGNPEATASIEGYAEPGKDSAGLALRRTLAVEKMLISRGIDRKRTKIFLFGGSAAEDSRSVRVIVR